jgi:hypothetical protein
VLWRIYYADGATFSSADGAPHEAPSEGFVCAVGYEPSGRRYIMHGWNFYRFDHASAQWWGMDQFGLHDALRRNDVYAYKEGRTVRREVWEDLMQRANLDPDFPQTGK